ncbi:hypothetical protein TrCOL_g2386 [Triparma columacea]|uniref:Uncharacterized protein n=1 Tax=Triparma columacea TaxID=722753 RepID=A0A9W7GD48_9STRA|nr:hypothetical protein TrCOL_g2386 [Triparma columacea]
MVVEHQILTALQEVLARLKVMELRIDRVENILGSTVIVENQPPLTRGQQIQEEGKGLGVTSGGDGGVGFDEGGVVGGLKVRRPGEPVTSSNTYMLGSSSVKELKKPDDPGTDLQEGGGEFWLSAEPRVPQDSGDGEEDDYHDDDLGGFVDNEEEEEEGGEEVGGAGGLNLESPAFNYARLRPSSSGLGSGSLGRPSSAVGGSFGQSTTLPAKSRTFETDKAIRKYVGVGTLPPPLDPNTGKEDTVGSVVAVPSPMNSSPGTNPKSTKSWKPRPLSGRARRPVPSALPSPSPGGSVPPRPRTAGARLKGIKSKTDSRFTSRGTFVRPTTEQVGVIKERSSSAHRRRVEAEREVLRQKVLKASSSKVLYRYIKGERRGTISAEAVMNNNEPHVYYTRKVKGGKEKARINVNKMRANGSVY